MVIRRQSLLRIALFGLVLAACVLYLVSRHGSDVEEGLELHNNGTDLAPPAVTDAPVEVADLPVVVGWDAADEEYFVTTRMDREQVRSRQLEWLRSVAGDDGVEAETRARAGEDLVRLLDVIARETELESLIRSKGFDESLVFLFEEAAVVVVRGGPLTADDVICLADMVRRVAGIRPENISVVHREQ